MTELLINVDDNLAERFKEVSRQKFQGNDTLAFEHAVKSILDKPELEMLQLEQIFTQIQDEIENSGGITDKEIDAYIASYRRNKRTEGNQTESRH